MTDEIVAKFKSDFKVIAEYFKALYNGEDHEGSTDMLEHPQEVVDFLTVFRNDKRYFSQGHHFLPKCGEKDSENR